MLLREDLADLMPMVNEANAISQELDKKVTYLHWIYHKIMIRICVTLRFRNTVTIMTMSRLRDLSYACLKIDFALILIHTCFQFPQLSNFLIFTAGFF